MRCARLLPVILAGAALAACDSGGAPGEAQAAAAPEIAWIAGDPEACGMARQDRMEWGLGVNDSGFEMQEVVGEDVARLRIWSGADADLTADGEVLTGYAQAPAWIGADIAQARGMIVHLEEGAAHVRVADEQFFCAPDAQHEM